MKTFKKADNTTTVQGKNGKIVTNLPAPERLSAAKTNLQNLNVETNPADTSSEDKSWTERQKEHTEGLLKAIEVGVENIAESGQIENFIKHMSKFHNYSLNNQMLIWIQNPEASQVAGYNRWEETGRQVRKGEKGLEILAPITFKVKNKDKADGEEDERTIMKGFRVVRVFDISQTEPAEHVFKTEKERDAFIEEWSQKGYEATINQSNPLSLTISKTPESPAKILQGEAPKAMVDFVEDEIKELNVKVEYKSSQLMGGANGQSWKDPVTGETRISVRDDVDDAQKYKTLVHEIMHVRLGHLDRMEDYHNGEGGHRGDMEVAVEALSFMVGDRFGLNTSDYSTGYMALWSKQNKDKLKNVLNNDVMPFYKKISSKLPSIEEETPPMGTVAQKKKAAKPSKKKTSRFKK